MTAVLEAPAPAAAAATVARTRGQRVVVWWLAAVSFLAAWSVGYLVVLGGAEQHATQARLYATFREQLAQGVAPVSPTREGRPVALLHSDRLSLDEVVVEGVTSTDLQAGPGHRRDTVLPGQSGTSILYGRAVTFGAPFAHLDRLRVGDRLDVTTGQGAFAYVVTGRRSAGDRVPGPVAEGTGHLVLVSATGEGAVGRATPHRLLLVDASLAKAAPAAPHASTLLPQERVFAPDTSALLALVLWLGGLLVLVLVAVWTWARWGRWQCWVAFTPVLVAVLAGASGPAGALLPNLL